MVWRLVDDPKLKEVFQQLCALVLNLNNSVFNSFYDRILDFSTAVTGTLFFVPTRNMLDDFTG